MKTRYKAAGIHLFASIAIALIIGLIFSLVYFPGYYFSVFDGWHRFFLIVGVDVVLGPLLTLVIFNTKKPRTELIRDVSIIAFIQICALIYGLYVFTATRPVYTVYDGSILTFTSANEYMPEAFESAPEAYRTLPKTGPQDVFARMPVTKEEKLKVTFPIHSPMMYEAMTDAHRKQMYARGESLDKLDPALTEAQITQIRSKLPEGISDIAQLKAVPANGVATVEPYLWAIVNPQGQVVSVQPIKMPE